MHWIISTHFLWSFILIKILLIVLFSFTFIGFVFSGLETCPWVCYQIFCEPYPRCKNLFASSADFRTVAVRGLVGSSYLFTSIDWFFLTKISSKLIYQDFLCLLSTCVFAIIGSAFFDPETYPLVCYKIVCGAYPRCTYRFAPPVGLRKVVESLTVVWLYLSTSSSWLPSSQPSQLYSVCYCIDNFISFSLFRKLKTEDILSRWNVHNQWCFMFHY